MRRFASLIVLAAITSAVGIGATAAAEPDVIRLAGPDRFATAVAVSQHHHPAGADLVIVASGAAFPDGLAGGPVAARLGAPLLLTRPDTLPGVTRDEIIRLDPDTILLLGGIAAVSDAVAAELATLAPTTRIAGADRYHTAVAISQHAFSAGEAATVVVATGAGFADALAGAPLAALLDGPVLLTRPDTLPQATRDEILRLDPDTILLLGGTAAVSDAVAAELAALAPTTRIAGTDRYHTAVAISQHAFPAGEAATVVVATGAGFADALAGAPLAALLDGPVLLTGPDTLPQATRDEILRLDPDTILLLGGIAAVSDAVAAELAALAPTTRIAGTDRYRTAVEISRYAFAFADAVYVAVGTDFADALAGGAAAAATGSPVLLTRTTHLHGPLRDEILRLDPVTVFVLGGTAVIDATVAAQLAEPASLDGLQLDLVEVASGFTQPLFVASRPGDGRLYVVEQGGRIWSMQPNGSGRAITLDISSKVSCCGERGLLGIAFDPADPSRLFVHYTAANGTSTIERHHFPLGATAAGPNPVDTILTVAQPFSNHNGGMLAFGPDGLLYVALGDGGSGDDPLDHGQNPSTLLGTILRIDVSGPSGYAIPPDNPFANGIGGAAEVWAYGLRNPWRFSFDGDLLYIGDVGQNRREEVDLLHIGDGGANLGWAIMEGTLCNEPGNLLCDANDFVDPIHQYSIQGSRCAITGGYVSRGDPWSAMWGAYFFGDFCTGEIMGLRVWDGAVVAERVFPLTAPGLSSFGIDNGGRLYVTRLGAGTVLRLVDTD